MFASQESRVTAEPSLAAVSQAGQARTARVRSWLLPSLSDVLFFVLLSILFMNGSGWSELLADSDTGWHIRTGEYILRTHTVPVWDLFSYTDPGTHWYAWEWLADVLFAALHQAAGFKGVVLFSGAVICLTMIVLFRHMMWRGARLHIAVLLTIFVADALRFHYLARPHIFTTLFAVIALWMLDRDWSRPSRAVWMLVPLTVLWTNVHGGFLILIVALGCFAVSALLRRETRRFTAILRPGRRLLRRHSRQSLWLAASHTHLGISALGLADAQYRRVPIAPVPAGLDPAIRNSPDPGFGLHVGVGAQPPLSRGIAARLLGP